MIQCVDPIVVFLMETKMTDDTLDRTLRSLGFHFFVFCPPVGLRGGLAFCWRPNITLDVLFISKFLFCVKVHPGLGILDSFCCFVYHPTWWQDKVPFWHNFHLRLVDSALPFICLGDFNDLLSGVDKRGGRPVRASSSTGLAHSVEVHGLVDLGFFGPRFTWSNGRPGRAHIKECLDRGLASVDWRTSFPHASIEHLPLSPSDHLPLVLNFWGLPFSLLKPFKFEEFWLRDHSCFAVVEAAWRQPVRGVPEFILFQKLKATKVALKRWNTNCFSIIQDNIQSVSRQILAHQVDSPSEEILATELSLKGALDELLKREESLWRQKSRICWLTSRELNTKFFHVSTIIRRSRNSIHRLQSSDHLWHSGRSEVGNLLLHFFQDLYTLVTPSFPFELDGLVSPMVFDEDNSRLCATPTSSEIFLALKNMPSHKAPGPDGMTGFFFISRWGIVGEDVVAANLVLIPKVEAPSSPAQFRPISLCNVVYKLITKIMADRLKLILPRLVSPFQSAFLPGNQIQDNYIVASELFHSMAHKQGRQGWFAIKGDMEKAYDRVEWSFLMAVLRNFGFSSQWMYRVFQCISTGKFSILLNGSLFDYFSSSRGLCQGDPLSPFLFILVFEILSRLLLRVERSGRLIGLKINASAPPVSYLLFADDLLIFAKATFPEVEVISECLDSYMLWSGQLLNRGKSSIHFSRNTSYSLVSQIASQLRLSPLPAKAKHLGLPLIIPRSKSLALADLTDRLLGKLRGWKAKLLSQAGRSTLLASVGTALPAYGMSVLCFPLSWCQFIERAFKKFGGASPLTKLVIFL